MRILLQREIERLKRQILELSAEVEENLVDAVTAVENRDPGLAQTVAAVESTTNAREIDIEEECLKILALHQPVAGDLRYIVGVLKINQDLERIGDLAVHISERGAVLAGEAPLDGVFSLNEMALKARLMLKKSLDAFVNLNAGVAEAVCAADSEVDLLKKEINRQVLEAIRRQPERLEAYLQVMHVARHLERIADHATNIAEDLIYMVQGDIVRHRGEAGIGPRPPVAGEATGASRNPYESASSSGP
jgi:phosphate transport system protein